MFLDGANVTEFVARFFLQVQRVAALLFVALAASDFKTTVAAVRRPLEALGHRNTGSGLLLLERRLARICHTLGDVGKREEQALICPWHKFAE